MASTSISLRQAFVLEPEMLRRVTELLTSRIGVLAIVGTCADAVDREFKTVKELLAYDNVRTRALTGLRLDGHSDDWTKRAVVSFAADRSSPVELSITGSEQVVVRLQQDLLQLLGDTRPWYSRLAMLDLLGATLIAMLGLWIVALIVGALGLLPVAPPAADPDRELRLSARYWLYLLGILLAGWILERFKKRVFPAGTFALGNGGRRHQTLETIRWVVVVSFVVSLAAGLFVSLMTGGS